MYTIAPSIDGFDQSFGYEHSQLLDPNSSLPNIMLPAVAMVPTHITEPDLQANITGTSHFPRKAQPEHHHVDTLTAQNQDSMEQDGKLLQDDQSQDSSEVAIDNAIHFGEEQYGSAEDVIHNDESPSQDES